MKINARFIIPAAAGALALFALAGPRLAAAISGGAFNLPSSAVITGGLRSTGGSMTNYSSIGGYGTAMTGGTLTLIPGTLASVKTSRLNLDGAHAYPTPFIPSKGHTGITFTALPPQVKVRIFSLSGRLVRTLEKNDSTDSLLWSPVVNEQGSPLASGVFLFSLSDAGTRKRRGKIMIIR